MNFSFPPLSSAVERRRLLTMALLVLLGHGVLGLALSLRRPASGSASRIPIPADDTPELLRLSRAPLGAETPPLATVPLGALPPPPPSLMPTAEGPAPATAIPTAAPSAGVPAPALPARLADAAAALRTLQLGSPGPLLAATERDQLAALQRRQWWLSAAQESLAQELWQKGGPVTALPDALGPLPEGGELRRLGAGPLVGLGSGDWHGHSLLSRQGALLIWRQAGKLWLLRLPWPTPETLTSS